MPSELAVSFRCKPVATTEFAREEDESPAQAVVEEVARLEESDASNMAPLHESVETDSLNKLFEHEPSQGSPLGLCFTYSGWNVFVCGDGTIIVGDPDQTGEPTPLFEEAAGD